MKPLFLFLIPIKNLKLNIKIKYQIAFFLSLSCSVSPFSIDYLLPFAFVCLLFFFLSFFSFVFVLYDFLENKIYFSSIVKDIFMGNLKCSNIVADRLRWRKIRISFNE